MAQIASLELLAHDLGLAGPKVIAKTKTVLKKTALDIEANAKAIVPVDTGDLKNSIGHSDMRLLSPSNMFIEIGPTVNYGQYVELGTSRQAPQAYMGPSADRYGPSFEAAMQQLGAEVLDG